jgi:hypothetical protein
MSGSQAPKPPDETPDHDGSTPLPEITLEQQQLAGLDGATCIVPQTKPSRGVPDSCGPWFEPTYTAEKQALFAAYAAETGSWEKQDQATARDPNPNPEALRAHRARYARLMRWKCRLEDLHGIGNLPDPEPYDRVCAVRYLALHTQEQINLLGWAQDEGYTNPKGKKARKAWNRLLRPLRKLVQAVKRLELSSPPLPVIPSKADAASVEQYVSAVLDWCDLFHQEQAEHENATQGVERSRRDGPIPGGAVEALLGEEFQQVLKVARSNKSADDKMRLICGIDRRFLGYHSPK